MDEIVKIQNGDKELRKKFIIENQGLVKNIAFKYLRNGVDVNDLIGEGNLGLMKALDKFDVSKGYQFSTYAVWWIKHMIQQYLCTQTGHLTTSMKTDEELSKYRKARNFLVQSLKREPTLEEISKECKISRNELEIIIATEYDALSFDESLCLEDGMTLEEVIDSGELNPIDLYEQKELMYEIQKIIYGVGLTDKQIKVLIMRYGLNGNNCKTFEEISKILGVSRQRVKQIEQLALQKIKESELLDNISVFTNNGSKIKK